MRALIAALGIATVLATPVWAAGVEGRFKVAGVSPNGGTYSGTVEVSRTADKIYKVNWMIGSKASLGTGIGDGSNYIAVGYQNNNSYGICLVVPKGDNAEAIWTSGGGKTLGAEQWTRE